MWNRRCDMNKWVGKVKKHNSNQIYLSRDKYWGPIIICIGITEFKFIRKNVTFLFVRHEYQPVFTTYIFRTWKCSLEKYVLKRSKIGCQREINSRSIIYLPFQSSTRVLYIPSYSQMHKVNVQTRGFYPLRAPPNSQSSGLKRSASNIESQFWVLNSSVSK